MLEEEEKTLRWWDLTDLGVLSIGDKSDGSPVHPYASFGSDPHQEEEFSQEALALEKAVIDPSARAQIVLSKSELMLAIISQYVSPLLYGLLGALAYTLRALSWKIHNVTFTRGSEIRYALRWPLGMLGGVIVGLFFDPTDFSGFAAITPLGLAFLAGGVELLFTGLDRMLGAFIGEGTERQRSV